MASKNKSLFFVDIAKFICAIFVILIHTSFFQSLSGALEMAFRNTLLTIAVPFFFTTSGFFLFDKIEKASESERLPVLIKTLKRLCFLYLFYSVLYFPFVVKGWVYNGFGINSVISYIYGFFFVGSYSTIWYLLASIVAVFVSYLVYTKLGLKKGFILALCFYAFGTLISSWYGLIDNISIFKTIADAYYFIFTTVKNGVMFGWVYIMLGAIVHKLYSSSKTLTPRTSFWLTAFAFILVCAEAVIQWRFDFATKGIDLKFSLVFFTLCFISFVLSLDIRYQDNMFLEKHKNVWIHLRKLSILMFLLQRIPLSLFPTQMNSFVYTAVIFITTLILSEIVILLSKKFKFFKLIY